MTRQFEDALAACDRSIALGPDPTWQAWPHLTKAFNYWCWKGGTPEARAALEFVPVDHEFSAWAWFWQELYEGKNRHALARLDAIPGGWIRNKIAARPTPLLAAIVHDILGRSDLAREAHEVALAVLEAELRTSPDDPLLLSSVGIAYAGLGRRDDALRAGRRAVELLPLSQDAFYGIPQVVDLAFIHTLLDEDDDALDQLEILRRRPSWISPGFLEADPRWNRLREHPRFVELLDTES
ncbi:MAG: hypothetical protein ACE5GX_03115 [Thermoanaerobaculia bacterium]